MIAYGTFAWQQDPGYRQYWSGSAVVQAGHTLTVEQAPGGAIGLVEAR